MSDSFAEQLSNVKLKSSKNKTKDFSDPKLAGEFEVNTYLINMIKVGFITKDQISAYQKTALEANMEEWQMLLADETFPTIYCPITYSDAKHFIRIFERYFQKLHEHQLFDQIRAQMHTCFDDDQEEKQWYEQIKERLQKTIDQAFPDTKNFFAKTSSRSAKDTCIFKEDFLQIYRRELSKFPDPLQENSRITALLTAAFLSLCVTSAADVLSMFIISERIYQDMLLATEAQNTADSLFKENIILRPFIPIDVDMEFRGFVFQRRLTCISQYNYLIYSQRLCEWKDNILEKILSFFNDIVRIKLNQYKSNSYVIDFALAKGDDESVNSMKVWVIELNPFMETTDGALFSWQHERDVLEGQANENKDKTLFRITERVRPGSWTMLPISIRQWIKDESGL
ncbi:unnamed protein product [Rotaria socialis]|uniref:Cell division cycle protein 123 homolog n=1 Tax=Rotaria socialis TaxID=392032 RepID=A0A820QZT2_9BILA|nr:unnamed protein product [Rotaria socialis]CAF4429355.1 unnamed protein product [Rotaria socialis]CAF4501033.1 unnamed protein product [Rotaria socialis]